MLEAEELVGHEFNDDEDHLIAVREMVGLGAHEAIMTAPDGCYALMGPEEPGAPKNLYRVRMPPARSSRARRSAPATRSWPASSPAATRGAPRSSACAYGVACGAESTQHLGAGLVDPEQVGRLRSEIEVERPALVG